MKRLLVRRPALRLGVQAGGADDIKRHPWFTGFDWAAFEAHTLKAPYVPKVGAACPPAFDVCVHVGMRMRSCVGGRQEKRGARWP